MDKDEERKTLRITLLWKDWNNSDMSTESSGTYIFGINNENNLKIIDIVFAG